MKWDPEKQQWKRESSDQEPPDLIGLISNLFSSKNQKTAGPGGSQSSKTPLWPSFLLWIFLLLMMIYCASGFYIVRESQQALVLRFGQKYAEKGPGLYWRARGIDRVFIVDTQAIYSFKKENMMLTEDQNMVSVGFEIQYRKHQIEQYLMASENAISILHQLVESSIRDAIGHSSLDEILTSEKQKITANIQKQIQFSLDAYAIGLEVIDVNLSYVLPPESVQAAFNDVIKAIEDEQTYQNEALRYRESQIPQATAAAQRVRLEAQAYHDQRVQKAQAHAQAFETLAKVEKDASDIVRKKMYYDTLKTVFADLRTVVVDEHLGSQMILMNDTQSSSLEAKAGRSIVLTHDDGHSKD